MCNREVDENMNPSNDNPPKEECLKALITAAEAQASNLHDAITTQKKLAEKVLYRIIKLSTDLATGFSYGQTMNLEQVFKTLDKTLVHLFSNKRTIKYASPDKEIDLERWTAWRARLPRTCNKAIDQLDELIMADLKNMGGNPESHKDVSDHVQCLIELG